MISTVRKIPPVLLIILCTLCRSVSGQAGGADRDSLLRENRLLREQLEHLQARREAFRWRRFPDGPLLRSGTVMQIAPGPGSRLAFATDSQGLVLFDGTRLEVYDSENSSLPDNFVTATALFDDKLWIGTAAGLAVLDAGGVVHRPAPLPGELAGGTVSCLLAAADSSLWAGTQGAGLWRFDGERWQQFTSPDTAAGPGDINALAPTSRGDGVWAATAGDGIWRVTGGVLERFSQPLGPGSEEIYSVITDSDALVWIGAAGAGAGFWDGFGWQSAPLPVSGGAGVICIAELANGDLFFGTTEGAWFYVRQGNSWEKLPLPEEIAAAPIVAAAGRKGRLWLAPSGNGVYFYDRGLTTRFDAASGLPSESVYQINQSGDGRIWLSTFGGVATYDGRRWSRLGRRSGLPDNLVTFTLFGAGDTVVFATHAGAGILSGGRWKYLNRDLGLRSNTINHLALDSRDGLWLSTEGGGLTLSYKDSLLTYTTADGLPANQVQATLPTAGDSVWVATKRGLALIAGGRVLRPAADNETDETWPPAVHYTALAMDSRGALWAASAGDGVWRRDAAGHWEKFGVENGLGSNEVYAVAASSDGRLFFGTRAGLSIFDGSSWRNLSGQDGLSPGALRSVFIDSGGALWLSGDRNGVLRFDPARLDRPETYLETPSGALCALDPAGKPVRLTRADSPAVGRLMLGSSRYAVPAGPAGTDTVRSNRINLSIHAATPWWNTPQSDFTFQWRLDNAPWSSHLAGGHLTVFDLSRGSHVLEVRARDPYLRLDPTPASYSFYVDVPTLLGDWRFWAAAFMLVGGALGLWQRRRLQWWLSIIRHRRRFRPVTPNPFNPNAPQSKQERFRGRGELLERLAGLFDGKDHGSVIIHGDERIGMTSFLLQCRNLAGRTGTKAVYLDLAADALTDIDQLATRLAAKMTTGENSAEHGKNNALDNLAALLETGSEPTVLIFDNAELLGRLLSRDSERGKSLMALFRAAVLKDRAAAFVFGTAELNSFRESAKTLFEMSRLYRLGPVSMDEAAAILTHPLQGRAVIHARALEMLTALSGGQPYLLQWLGRELVEVINAGQSSLVTLELAGRAVARLVADPPLPLLDSWEELPRREKLMLAAMYKIRAEGDGGSMAVDDIRAVLAGHGIEMLAEELAKAAADLSERNLLKLDAPSATLAAPDTLLGRWIASATSIPAIAARQEYDIGEALHRFSDELSRSFRLDELAGRVLSFFESVLRPEYSALLTARPADGDGEKPLLVLESAGGSGTVARLPEKIPAAALERITLIAEKTAESAPETSGFPAGCVLVPLLARGTPVGLVVLGPRRDGERYNSRDRMLLETCAEQTAVAMENSRLYEEETEKERLKQELDTARRMQMAILPERKPDIPGLDFCAYLSPATEVGGDYYDYKLLDSGQLVFVIGDVSGHGVSAGTLVTMSKSCIFNQLRTSHAVEQVMSAMNEMVYGALAEKLLMTLCYAIIDPAAGKLVYSIAGHPFPYHVHALDGTMSELDISAYPLGVTRKASFRTAEVNFAPGDSFVFFSDGIVEAQNPENEQWGFERFEQVVTGNAGLDAESLSGKILSEFDNFRRGVPQDDDVTLVTIKVR